MVETMSDLDQELELREGAHAGRMRWKNVGVYL